MRKCMKDIKSMDFSMGKENRNIVVGDIILDNLKMDSAMDLEHIMLKMDL